MKTLFIHPKLLRLRAMKENAGNILSTMSPKQAKEHAGGNSQGQGVKAVLEAQSAMIAELRVRIEALEDALKLK